MPAAVDNLVLQALQKRPEDRFQSMLELERALLAIDDSGHNRTDRDTCEAIEQTPLCGSAVNPAPPPSTPPRPAAFGDGPARSPAQPRRRSPRWSTAMVMFFIGWMVVMAGGVVLGAWLVARHVASAGT